MKVWVVDTNVLTAALVTSDSESATATVLDCMLSGRLAFLLSPDLLAEYRAVLLRPKLTALHGLSMAEIDQLLVDLVANAIWREPDTGPPAPDRGDDHLWALLATMPEAALITGDRLLIDHPLPDCRAISPREWLDAASLSSPRSGY